MARNKQVSPNDFRYQKSSINIRKISRNEIEQWNECLKHAVKECLFREPTFSDYTFFSKEKIVNKSYYTCKLFWKGIELGIVKNSGGKLKFIAND